MLILEFNKNFWTIIPGIYLNKPKNKSNIILSGILNLFYIINSALLIYASVIEYFCERETLSVMQLSFVLLQISLNSTLLVNYLIYCNRKSVLYKLIDNFQRIVQLRLNILNADSYKSADRKSYLAAKYIFITYCAIYNGGFVLSILQCFVVLWLNGNKTDYRKWPTIVHIRFVFVIR